MKLKTPFTAKASTPEELHKRWMDALVRKHPHDVAAELRDLPLARIREALRELPDALAADVVLELPRELQVRLFESMRVPRLSGIISEMFTDEAADVLGQISSQRLEEIMGSLSAEDAQEIDALLQFPADSAGGIMHTEFIALTEEQTVGQAVEHLRGDERVIGQQLSYLYVVDDQGRLRGVLKMRDLLFRKPETPLTEVVNPEVRCVSVHADQEEIARLFQHYEFLALPVVDDFQRLRGVVTGDDVLKVIQEEATEDMQRMVGLFGQETGATPWGSSVRNRLPWLLINLVTAFFAGWVVSHFESLIAQYAVLAVFLPIIAGQGGNAGTQTLTIIVRALALGEIQLAQVWRVLAKEILIGLITGIVTGSVVGIIGWMWKGNAALGVVACMAMILNLIAAALAGVVIPMGLKAMKIDPALASAIMLTTVTDVVGFFIFLTLASAALPLLVG